jgi:hypothetical protein
MMDEVKLHLINQDVIPDWQGLVLHQSLHLFEVALDPVVRNIETRTTRQCV